MKMLTITLFKPSNKELKHIDYVHGCIHIWQTWQLHIQQKKTKKKGYKKPIFQHNDESIAYKKEDLVWKKEDLVRNDVGSLITFTKDINKQHKHKK